MINNIHDNFIIKSLKCFLDNNNEHAYVVGGFVRDCLLGISSNDVDIVVEKGHAQSFAVKFAQYLDGFFVELDIVNNIYRVVFPDKVNYVDIADCTGMSIEDDLKRRDFTINSLAYDISNKQIIDVLNGVNDLKNNLIREVSLKNIEEDSIRILRAYRFKSQLGFDFSDELKCFFSQNTVIINNTAKERVNAELIKLFDGEFVVDVLKSMDEVGLLEILIPEVKGLKTIPPNSHHHLPLFEHSLETVKQVQLFYENSNKDVKEHLNDICFGGSRRLAYLKMAAFLHDVGKPKTWYIEPDTGRHRFIKHDSVGAELIVSTLKDLKFSKKQISYIQKIIKNHIYPSGVICTEGATEKARLRFYRKMEQETIDVIAVAYADRLSALGPEITEEIVQHNITGLNDLLYGYFAEKSKLGPLPKLLDGKEIMDILNMSPSPELGSIINQLKEAQISSEVNTREDAIEFVKQFLK